MMGSIGDRAPGFTLPGADGDRITTFELSEYVTDGTVVLVFYPFDFSPICTRELCEFRDAEWLTVSPDIHVFGVSTESAYAHRRFIDEHDISFPLLSDTSGDVIEAYGVQYDEWEGHRAVAKRGVVILDSSQRIRYRWTTEDASETPDIGEIHAVIDGFTSLCLPDGVSTPG